MPYVYFITTFDESKFEHEIGCKYKDFYFCRLDKYYFVVYFSTYNYLVVGAVEVLVGRRFYLAKKKKKKEGRRSFHVQNATTVQFH